MTTAALVLLALGMLAGLVGVVVPVMPGSLLIAVLTVAWLFADGPTVGHWLGTALVLAILLAGAIAKYAVPSRSLRHAGAPRSTLAVGVLGAIAGFFVIPIVGVPVGFVLAIAGSEYARLRTPAAAWRSTRATLTGIGIGIFLELTAATLAVAAWAAFAIALHQH